MFTLKFFLRRAFFALLCIGALCACGDSNGDEPEPPTPIDPNKDVPDPTGTISLSMRSKNGASTPTYLGNTSLHINEADNFDGYGPIVDLGAVKGLGNVSAIPKIGYAGEVKVTPSHGYVYCTGGDFYRIFVTDYIVDTGGGIIGADVKYQAPFYGKDEELKTDDKSLSFKAEGGEADVVFTNSSIIPFKVESDQPWCVVRSASTLDYSCLTDAIHIAVAGTKDTKESKAEITVTTLHGKTTKIAVTRLGVGPTARFNNPSSSVDAPAGVYTIPITTNMNLSELSVKSSESWAKVSLVTNTTTNKERTRSIKWIGNEKAPQSQNSATAFSTYYCRVEVDENTSVGKRAAEITLSSKDGKILSKHTLSQIAHLLVIEYDSSSLKDNTTIKHSADGGSLDIYVYSNSGVELSSSASWASISFIDQSSNRGHYRINTDANNTPNERTATITAKVKNGTKSSSFMIVQDAGYIDLSNLSKDSYYDDRNGATHTLTIKGTLPLDASTTDASWCTAYVSGNNLAITTIPTTQNRQAVVTITGGNESFKITVYQTKWATGDKNGDATVQLNEDKSFLHKYLPTYYAWSTQQIVTGAVSEDDGVANTKKIHSIPNWQSLYPAFAAIEELNTNGESGWYMPAKKELILMWMRIDRWTWSSTELSDCRYAFARGDYSERNENKINKLNVIAAKRFDAYKIE